MDGYNFMIGFLILMIISGFFLIGWGVKEGLESKECIKECLYENNISNSKTLEEYERYERVLDFCEYRCYQ